jgi:thiosulfate/3-mercaptopyruvate sulfurtransferase
MATQTVEEGVLRKGYVHPEVLVSTDWVASHLTDPAVRVIESNEDPLLFASGHIPGAVEVDWTVDLNDPVRRDYIQRDGFERLARRIGVTRDTTVVFYGDKHNWWATYAFWVFQLFGHTKARVMDGGRLKWQREKRPFILEAREYPPTEYSAPERDDRKIRAFREEVMEHVGRGDALVDVRSREEFTGRRLHMEDYPNEGALRGGHIPGAVNVPWSRASNPEDGTFRSADQLRDIYIREQSLDPRRPVVAYCRIGERSSHTWFVLTYLLGFKDVRNYDGSWTEWGNMVGVPIEK